MRFILLAPLLLSAAPAFSQVQEVVVTGRGLGQAPGEEAYDIVTIDREDLVHSASQRLDEILKDVPGFQLFRRSDARSANPTSQGATLRALGGNASSRALLILDGVPQTDPFGGWINWPALQPDRLGEVRVVRGGGSGVAGAGALAGTIELSSAAPGDLEGFTGEVSYGSRDSADVSANLGGYVGSAFTTLSAAYARGDGFIPIAEGQRGPVDRASPYRQGSLAGRALVPVGGATELQLSGLLFRDERERGTAFSANETEGADASARLVGPDWSLLGYMQARTYYNSFASVNDDRTTAVQVSEQYDVPSTGLGARAEYRPRLGDVALRLGADWRRTDGETREYYSLTSPIGPNRRATGGRTDTLGLYTEGSWQRDRLTLTLAGRIDRWWIAEGFLDEASVRTGVVISDTEYRDRAGWEPTGRAGIAYRISEAVTLRGAGYLGWRLPTLNELYRPFRVGAESTLANPDLDPERLKGAEIGMRLALSDQAGLNVTGYWNRLEDGIANLTVGTNLRRRGNLDAITSKGIEIDADARFGAFTLRGGYSYADARVDGAGASAPLEGLRPAQTPAHTASLGLAWAGEGARASITGRYVGDQFEDDLNQALIPDAVTLDAAASFALGGGLELRARVENLTDELVVATITERAGRDDLTERATPRTFWIGLRIEA